ncbi:hypothetical protein FAZ15_12760 [Sphingobacterium olei]|uniref:Uncharacterized protein n=1 Tax=Sphingobacterium olei TaxID=2571155 RepID=A0A4U0NY27_9SPHI|nr:hypothetical protein [Sphingobacterium olei]TJZ59766.1 hypothetical protein FAZ15_12760 [Sphingobacterium olei]
MNKFWVLLVMGSLPFASFSQKKKSDVYTFQSISNITVDGDLNEWNDQLIPVEGDAWSFGIVKEENKLLVAVRVQDPTLRQEAIRNGIIVNISYTGKKKDGAQLIYPFPDRERLRALAQDEELNVLTLQQELLNSSRGYYLNGFSRVVDGLLSFENSYGVKAVVKLDSNENLIYESLIPLELIQFKEDEVAVQLVVNNRFIQLQKMAKNRSVNTPYSVYGRVQPTASIRNPYKFKTDVWIFGKVK